MYWAEREQKCITRITLLSNVLHECHGLLWKCQKLAWLPHPILLLLLFNKENDTLFFKF